MTAPSSSGPPEHPRGAVGLLYLGFGPDGAVVEARIDGGGWSLATGGAQVIRFASCGSGAVRPTYVGFAVHRRVIDTSRD